MVSAGKVLGASSTVSLETSCDCKHIKQDVQTTAVVFEHG
jgi:hypothetical protein